MSNAKLLSHLVNVDVEMPKELFNALVLHETFCVASGIEYVTEEQVKSFLVERFGEQLANEFKPDYLYSKSE